MTWALQRLPRCAMATCIRRRAYLAAPGAPAHGASSLLQPAGQQMGGKLQDDPPGSCDENPLTCPPAGACSRIPLCDPGP